MNVHGAPMHQIAGGLTRDSEYAAREDRATTIYRPVLIQVGDFSGFCLVRNISAGGLLGVVYADFAKDASVTISFSDKLSVRGRVAWSEDGRIGVAFDMPINVDAVLRDLGSKMIENHVNRAPRLAAECPISLESAQRMENAVMHNISQRGLRVSSLSLRPADEVFVHIDGMEVRKAVVRWAENGMAGLNFVRPLDFDKLAHWVIELQSRRWTEQRGKV